LRGATGGKAFPQCSFDHWETMTGNPLDKTDPVGAIVEHARKRKGLAPEITGLDQYLDKL
jgi:elongation factor 2